MRVKTLKRSLLLIAIAGGLTHALAQRPAFTEGKPRGTAVLVSLSRPSFPPIARTANVSGQVKVLVTVHQDGSAEKVVLEGQPLLKNAALESAKSSVFECQQCEAPVQYAITYNFERTQRGNCCDGFTAPVELMQGPETTDDQGLQHTEVVISAEHICLCDPAGTISPSHRRSLKCLYLWKCAAR